MCCGRSSRLYVGEGGFDFVRWVINDRSDAFGTFASEFGDEGRVVIVVGDDVDDDIDEDDWCVAMVCEWGAKARVLDEATVLKK